VEHPFTDKLIMALVIVLMVIVASLFLSIVKENVAFPAKAQAIPLRTTRATVIGVLGPPRLTGRDALELMREVPDITLHPRADCSAETPHEAFFYTTRLRTVAIFEFNRAGELICLMTGAA